MVGYHSWCTTGVYTGTVFLNIFLCDMFLFCNDKDFASFADDNTLYCIGNTPEEVISQLDKSSKSIFEWFENNGMKVNLDKRHLLWSKNVNFEANINENRISNTIVPCSKQAPYLKFKWQQRDSNPQPLSLQRNT